MILDTDLIIRRRRHLGLSTRTVAKHLGVTSRTIAGIEAGSNHATLPLGLVQRLADVLGCTIGHLTTPPEPGPVVDPGIDNLAGRIGGLLLDTTAVTPLTALAEALDVTIDTIRAAVDRLDSLVQPVGMVVHRLGSAIQLRSQAGLPTSDLTTLTRRHLARAGLKHGEARILAQAVAGTLDEGKLGNADTVALGVLRNAGLVTTTGSEPTDDVRLSILLD